MSQLSKNHDIFKEIRSLIIHSRNQAVRAVNSTMVLTYYEIGRIIVEHEQGGEKKAKYGKETLKDLSGKLINDFGRGFSVDNLENMRKFFLVYPKSETVSRILDDGSSILKTVSAKSNIGNEQDVICEESQRLSEQFPKFNLSWSHYVFLIRLDESERNFYEIEASQNNWSVRELERQFNSGLFQRLSLSKNL